MSQFFNRLKIRAKLLAAFGSIILLSVLLIVYAFIAIDNIIELGSIKEEGDKLAIQLERIELAYKEFISEGYKQKSFQQTGVCDQTTKFEKALADANQNLQTLLQSGFGADSELKPLLQSMAESAVINESFIEIKSLLKQRGFKDEGLEGALRESIHRLEKSEHDYDKTLMLTLRRHEKDFFLRKELKYQDQFNAAAEKFEQQLIEQNDIELIALLQDYKTKFNEVVAIEKAIGLDVQTGKRGEFNRELVAVRSKIDKVQQLLSTKATVEIIRSRWLLFIIFIVQLVFAIILAIAYSHIITSVIKEIRLAITSLAEGIFPKPLPVKTSEEIGQTKQAFNQFLERLQTASAFAEKLGTGQLKEEYDKRFTNDVLAKSIIAMQQRLRTAEQTQAKINWTNEGAARFNDLLKQSDSDLSALSHDVLKFLIQYVDANQGVLYRVNESSKTFDRLATYAYGKKKFINEVLSYESGLLGQCFYEGQSIYLKEVPTDYVKITSGLGEATPSTVLIVPLKSNEKIVGIIELASFNLFEEHQQKFIEKIAESIAAILINRQTNEQTKILLFEAQQQKNELAEREEAMRQHAEELQATQEEMERQRRELENEIKQLQSKLTLQEY